MKKSLKRHGSPKAITTDGLRSYKAAMAELGNTEKQEVGRWTHSFAVNMLRLSVSLTSNRDSAHFVMLDSRTKTFVAG